MSPTNGPTFPFCGVRLTVTTRVLRAIWPTVLNVTISVCRALQLCFSSTGLGALPASRSPTPLPRWHPCPFKCQRSFSRISRGSSICICLMSPTSPSPHVAIGSSAPSCGWVRHAIRPHLADVRVDLHSPERPVFRERQGLVKCGHEGVVHEWRDSPHRVPCVVRFPLARRYLSSRSASSLHPPAGLDLLDLVVQPPGDVVAVLRPAAPAGLRRHFHFLPRRCGVHQEVSRSMLFTISRSRMMPVCDSDRRARPCSFVSQHQLAFQRALASGRRSSRHGTPRSRAAPDVPRLRQICAMSCDGLVVRASRPLFLPAG